MGKNNTWTKTCYTSAAIASTEKSIRELVPYYSVTLHDVTQNSPEEITGFSS